jgi:hypothetical protein
MNISYERGDGGVSKRCDAMTFASRDVRVFHPWKTPHSFGRANGPPDRLIAHLIRPLGKGHRIPALPQAK